MKEAKYIYHVEVRFNGDGINLAKGTDLPGGMTLDDNDLKFLERLQTKLDGAYHAILEELNQSQDNCNEK